MIKLKHTFLPVVLLALLCLSVQSQAQDKLKKMPGYDQYVKVAPKIRSSVKRGDLRVKWSEDGSSFEYSQGGRQFRYDVKKGEATDIGKAQRPQRRRWNRPARGRQYASADSPDGKLKAFTKDRNMYLSYPDGNNVVAITTDGNDDNQVKYGIATWVYGEELGQITAMWWSPDSKKVASTPGIGGNTLVCFCPMGKRPAVSLLRCR